MRTSVIGFPRIGASRELKFSTEKFFRNELSIPELQEIAHDIKVENWLTQQAAEITHISSNDFSFYDNVLDAAALFNIVPSRYRDLGLSTLDTYFAMARGYQGEAGDVKALAMKKWFNTNYHYMVPEIADDTEVKLVGDKPIEEFLEAQAAGVDTKPVVVGPFTLLKLIRYTGEKRAADFADDFVNAYTVLLTGLRQAGAAWVQLDEPYLVRDLSAEDIALFEKLYSAILPTRESLQILLQTYFGDVRDCYTNLCQLDFSAIGLDFVEGKQTESLIREHGFPQDKTLFAGLLNGKNIWRNNYEKTLTTLEALNESGISTVLSTSCSLLHVPYSLESETSLPQQYTAHFSFAKEKLGELSELQVLADVDFRSDAVFQRNAALFTGRENCHNPQVQERVSQISEENFVRLPEFSAREALQKATLNLPPFPTTTIGSFPQTSEVKAIRREYKNGKLSEQEYVDFNRNKIAECIQLQEELGLDVLVHGEFERNDMVEYFGEQLEGYVFTEKAWVQSYGTRCVKPPIIWGDVSRTSPMTVDWSVYAQRQTDKPVKGMLTGPVTILNWSFPREDISLEESTYQIALAIRDEVLDLEANGIRIIQVDEAALREKLPLRESDWHREYLDWAIPAFRLVHSGVQAQTQIHTHMCYSEFSDIIEAIDSMDADVITFEASRSDLLILDSLKESNFKTEVGPGVYDIHSPRVPSVEELGSTLRKIAGRVDPEKLWVNPDCGLKTRGETETTASLRNLVTAAQGLRDENS